MTDETKEPPVLNPKNPPAPGLEDAKPATQADVPKPRRTSAPADTLAKALVEAQAKMPAVDKTGKNPHFNSSFVTLDDLIAATRPILNQHGLSINQFPSVSEIGQPILITRITHGWSGESVEYAMPLMLGQQTMQGLGAAITYARRFAWAAALGIASDTDDDGNQASAQPAPPKEKAAKGARTITDAERRRLFAIAKDHAVGLDQLRQLIEDVTGDTSTSSITDKTYGEVIERIEKFDVDVPF